MKLLQPHLISVIALILLLGVTDGFRIVNPAQQTVTSSSSSKTHLHNNSAAASNDNNSSRLEDIVSNAKLLNPFNRLKKQTEVEGASVDDDVVVVEKSTISNVVLPSIAAGAAVALAMVPEAVAFSFVAGVHPLVGLWTTVILGFVAAAFGGRAGICSSASGACTVVVAALCASHGPAYLSGCALLAGLLQIAGGVMGLGKYIRLVPHPVMLGFVNGLSLVMGRAQLGSFKGTDGAFLTLSSTVGKATYGITALTMFLIKFVFPKFKALTSIPPSLGAVAIVSFIARLFNFPVKTLADIAGAETFSGGLSVLPKLGLPAELPLLSHPLETLKIILPYAITMAAVGAIESLLTLQLLDGLVDDGKRGSTKKECIGQGLGNVASGLTGGIGGCALLGQSLINVESGGGISRLSGMSMAVFLGMGIVGAAPLLGQIPVAALVGVMLLVCQGTFSWSSLRILNKIPKLDALIILLVSYVTVKDDLAKAVFAGTVTSCLGFAWKQSTRISASIGKEQKKKVYFIDGPLYFGSTLKFSSLFNPKSDPEEIIIDFTDSRVMDHSALEAINDLADKYGSLSKRVTLRKLSRDCAALLERVHGELPSYEVIETSPEDPAYAVVEKPSYYSDVPVSKE